MASEFNFKEKNIKLQEWWEEDNEQIPGIVETLIKKGYDEKITVSIDQARWAEYNDMPYASIGFYFASMADTAPIETVIGGIASIIKISGNKDPLTIGKNLTTAGEIVFMLSKYICDITPTYNGRLIVKSKIYTEALATTYMYPLPSNTPTTYHKTLGSFKWTLTETKALDKLNKLAFTVLDFPETEPDKKDDELYKKWLVRSKIRPNLKNHKLYFNWHSCYRGRMYAGGYHFNPQGNEYEKSILAFAKPEKITETGLVQLKLAIATAYGKGKLTDKEKFKWYNENCDARTATGMKKGLHAKEHETAVKLQYAMVQIKKTGYTNIPIELDGTNSQLQVISVLTGDKATAKTCNVIPADSGKIADAYQILADAMSALSNMRGIK